MFIVFLKFGANKTQAAHYMEEHKRWIKKGFDDEVFLCVGSLNDNAGGVILAQGSSRDELVRRVTADPFVEHKVVDVEISEASISRADPRLKFLIN